MNLSDLVAYVNYLDKIDAASVDRAIDTSLDKFLPHIIDHPIQFPGVIENFTALQNNLYQGVSDLKNSLTNLRALVKSNIDLVETRYYQESTKRYRQIMSTNSADRDLNRPAPTLSPEIESSLRAKLLSYSDWHHAGLIIHPGQQSWVQDLVAFDPLYYMDLERDMMQWQIDQFNPVFQNRIRTYLLYEDAVIQALDKQEPTRISSYGRMLFKALPWQHLGFVLAYDFFNYRPFEVVSFYMSALFNDLLLPGGVVVFTFNDCDRAEAVKLCEMNCACYTPARTLLPMVEHIGFEIVNKIIVDAATTWLEIKKPGQSISRRGGQSLAKVIAKN